MKVERIRIVSPSGAIETEYIQGAKERLVSFGFEVSIGEHASGRYGRFAGTDDERVADFLTAMQDERVDALLCSRGGYGLQRIIDRLGTVTKPIIGFSDITAVHQLAGLYHQPSLHGIMCKHIATLPTDSEPFSRTIDALRGMPLHYELTMHPLNHIGSVTAPLIGGNLSVLYGLQGTVYSLLQSITVLHQNPILLIEDIGERHYHIDRMMNNLRLSGVLSHISGLIVGQFTDCEDDEQMRETVYETISRYASAYGYPIVFDFPSGHAERNLPLWLNKLATLSVDSQHVRFTQYND